MYPVVFILHSESGNFSASLVANAIICVRAMCNTLCAHSPDFIPSCAILRADPVVGVQYIYSTGIPDGNHAINSSNIYSVLESLSLQSNLSSSSSTSLSSLAPSSSLHTAKDVPAALIGRSASYVADSTICGTCSLSKNKAENVLARQNSTTKSTSESVLQGSNVTKKITEENIKSNEDDIRDTWTCLAGALLTALCFLNKHQLMTTIPDHEITANTDSMQINKVRNNNNTNGGCIIIFSDSDESNMLNSEYIQETYEEGKANYENVKPKSGFDKHKSSQLSFSTECAFANVAVCLSKTSFTLHCFSKSVFASLHRHEQMITAQLHQHKQEQQPEKGESTNGKYVNATSNVSSYNEEKYYYYTTGASRVCALVNSLNGICAPEFSFAHLGKLFAIHSPSREGNYDTDKAVNVSGEHKMKPMKSSEAKDDEANTFTRRGRRERMAEQYVVTPTVLPQSLEKSSENVCGNLAWLCPRCMAIVEQTDRDMLEVNDNAQQTDAVNDENEGDDAEYCKICPYCANLEKKM